MSVPPTSQSEQGDRQIQQAATALVSRLSGQDLPPLGPPVASADDLLRALVAGADARGRYFASPWLLRRLFWWEDVTPAVIEEWLQVLSDRGDVIVAPEGVNVYGNDPVDIVTITNPRRFRRFSTRRPIPAADKRLVFARDGNACVTCGTTEGLTLDHIYPWSRGGSDDPDNLQVLCQPCNSRKGARV